MLKVLRVMRYPISAHLFKEHAMKRKIDLFSRDKVRFIGALIQIGNTNPFIKVC